MAENFDLIFGQNASQQYAWNDTDYQNGWETIGNIPPTAAQFDALQRRSDTKMKKLNDELTPLVNADTADNRQLSTAYNENDIKYSPLLPTGWYLICTVDGISSASELVVPTPVNIGDTIIDGTVTWTVQKIGSVDLSSYADIDLSNLSATGEAKFADPDLSNLTATGENHFLEKDFTIIYPNGGSKASPANVTKNTRYVETNPFPGYRVACEAEVFYNGEWGTANWVSYWNAQKNTSIGVNAAQLNDNSIIIQSGEVFLLYTPNLTGSPLLSTAKIATPLPCRVKVWKIGKIPT